MHGDQGQTDHQESEGQTQIAVVVEAADQHRDQQRCQHDAEAGRQNVDAAPINRHRQVVHAVPARGPGT